MSLLLNPTNVMGESKGIGGPAQVVLKKGFAAPYDGVLVPNDLFREYEINELGSNAVRKSLEECLENKNGPVSESVMLAPLWVIGGFVVGALATGALR